MNQNDYNEIAKIINKNNRLGVDTFHSKTEREEITFQLADYFEKEDIKQAVKTTGGIGLHRAYKFKREQFLKDCGVN